MADLRFQQRMSDSDALMWTIEKDPMLRSTITAVCLLDRAPDAKRLAHLLERGSRLVPRMRQRVRGNPLSVAPPRWEVDPHFDLSYHLRWVRGAGDRDLRSVLDLAQPMAMQGFDRARPLWEMVVVTDLADGGAALVMKIHHAITDGVGAVQIALVLFELERDVALAEMPDEPPVAVMNQLARFVDAFEHERRRNLGIAKRFPEVATGAAGAAAADPVGTARKLGEAATSIARLAAPANVPLSPLMTGRSLSVHFDTVTLSLTEAKAAAKAAGGRLNDAFMAATAAGLRRYHEELGKPVDAVRVSMPINLRGEGEGEVTGNNFAPARFAIPVGITDPTEAMRTMRTLVAAQRAEPALTMVEPLARVLNRLPTSMATGLFGAMLKGVDLVASNVPGAPIELFTSGARIDAMYALGPMAGAAVNVTLLSYLDDVHVGINVDPAAVTEPERFVACYRDGWDEVLAAGRPAGRRRRSQRT
ncbi:MAG TPA: wax ester/triacylglycerol synthase domain-containing protein [Aquihabitans sp.]|jgi:WS/DGAT/MGAT family acyltransferase|nr:wax ester/triacylglycerol synthase domain-containing protein [Aquihabitans sp.]